MEFEDPHEVIFFYFQQDYHNNSYGVNAHINNWREYVEYIDIGLEYIESDELVDIDHYKIVDEKKWFLSKLKYAI